MCINIKVYDAIAAHGRGVTLEQARELLPAIRPKSVTDAAHRLSIGGALALQRKGKTIVYSAKPGAQPADGRGRPRRIAVAPRSALRVSSRGMRIQDAQVYSEYLDQVVRTHSLESVSIEFVADVASWCAEHGVPCPSDPAGMAIRADQMGAAFILIRRLIDASDVAGIKSRMFAGGFEAWLQKLDTPECFLTHLVLHELAHLVGEKTEEDCDAWAFHAMGFR